MTDAEKFAAFRVELNRVLDNARQRYGVALNPLAIALNIKGRVAGWAGCKYCWGANKTRLKTYTLRFNPKFIVDEYQDMLTDTIPHEVAHLVCAENPNLGRRHDTGWKRVCIDLGGTGKRCHAYEVEVVGGYDYTTDLGQVTTVTAKVHQKLQAGHYKWFKNAKGKIYPHSPWCKQGDQMPGTGGFIPTTPAIPAPITRTFPVTFPTLQPVHRPVAPAYGMSKAEQVRMWIRDAKQVGGSQESVMATAMRVLSMPKSQAYRYVTENWARA